ncbi:hypothetical protein [Glycomyces salinus]|uniref:hypothetical protein n=1 Tax=Glycomyces salinus TaxID=980294 RepID=UPI0018EAE12A|nr:hypothetical protein [Glycomyces salinus]
MSDDRSRSNPWHWHEYPVGLGGEVARACVRALLAFLIGLGCSFVLILCVGLLVEEDMLGDPGLTNAVDDLFRMGIGVLMLLAVAVWAMFAVASHLREVTTSKALVEAAERDASRYDVPSPEQVESVTREPAKQLTYFGLGNAAVVGLLGVLGLGIALFGGEPEALPFMLIAVGYAAIMALVALAGPKWLTPAHERRQARIAAHWSANDEVQAWRPANRRTGREKKRFGLSIAERFMYGASVPAVLSFVALQASLSMRCASVPGRGHYECDDVTYSSPIESVLAVGFWIFAVLFPLAVLLAAVGVLLDWRQRRSERADLRERLADPRSGRPHEKVLAYHARRHMHPLALVGAAMSGGGLVFGISAYLVGQGKGLGSEDFFAVYRTESLVTLFASVGLFAAALLGSGIANARGRELRNALMRRWPTPPSWSAGEDGMVLRAKRGPALRGSRYVKVGKFKSSD